MTSSPHGASVQDDTSGTMAGTSGCDPGRWSQAQKAGLRSDWSLQLCPMKSESLGTADQHAAVNTFAGLVHTARPTTGVDGSRSA